MEAYHVIATHPQMLPGIGDANSQYDAWDSFSRAITPNMTPSPHLEWQPTEQDMLDSMFSRSLDAEPMLRVPEGMTARQLLAQVTRMQLQASVPSVQDLTDAELADSFYYTVFPNFHPWGAYNRIVYRFRPAWERPRSLHHGGDLPGAVPRAAAAARAGALARATTRTGRTRRSWAS